MKIIVLNYSRGNQESGSFLHDKELEKVVF